MSIIERAAERLKQDTGLSARPPLPAPTVAPVTAQAPTPAPVPPESTVAMESADSVDFKESDAISAPGESESGQSIGVVDAAPHFAARSTGKTVDIDLAALSELGFITAGGGRSLIAEQFRMIKRPLIKRAFAPRESGQNPGNLIMITSTDMGEGKTFCAINLAMSIAMEMDHTVLLVDVDVTRPAVLRTLGIEADGGLMDILLDEKVDMFDVMLKTNVDTLSILPAGKSHNHTAELLASQAMHVFLDEISTRYPDRIVIFDSPPLLVTSEAHILATKMGQIVLVVAAESTTQHAVKSALHQLEGCANVNLIFNKSNAVSRINNYEYWKKYQ
jgi:protein-tyrosine kinase